MEVQRQRLGCADRRRGPARATTWPGNVVHHEPDDRSRDPAGSTDASAIGDRRDRPRAASRPVGIDRWQVDDAAGHAHRHAVSLHRCSTSTISHPLPRNAVGLLLGAARPRCWGSRTPASRRYQILRLAPRAARDSAPARRSSSLRRRASRGRAWRRRTRATDGRAAGGRAPRRESPAPGTSPVPRAGATGRRGRTSAWCGTASTLRVERGKFEPPAPSAAT